MKKEPRSLLRIIFGRTALLALFVIIQIVLLLVLFVQLEQFIPYAYAAFTALGVVTVIFLISGKDDASIKLSWVIPLLAVPVFGTLFYLFFRLQTRGKRIHRRFRELGKQMEDYMQQDPEVMSRVVAASGRQGNLVRYMNRFGPYPIYENTKVEYFPLGDDFFPALLRELKRAEKFIFMEFFIVEHGVMWDSILEVLEQKVKEGVEVRFMYDGMGCLKPLPYGYVKVLRAKGIAARQYAPVVPALSSYQNNRDHRKVVVIDGHTAFTGGVNLADEYINQKVRFGHWKDTAVMLKGSAVTSFTVMFLQMWHTMDREFATYGRYLKTSSMLPINDGFVMPFGDTPLDGENVGEQVYLDILQQAKRYVHIMTPYLILDDTLLRNLGYAAKRGVDTAIIMPHIPDKKYAYLLARSYYPELIEAGVKIYEYMPGFVHAKSFVSDDEKAVVGTINLDFRSLYLHFECGVYLYRSSTVFDVEADFQKTLETCELITLENCQNYPFLKRFAGKALRLIAPMM